MTNRNPNVSVVIPAYHAERFVARAIQSVLDQPGVDPEIIVVVDGLVDRAVDIARGFPKTRVLINEVNRGAPAARNRGLELARAPYVMFLDADDWVEGPLLQGLVEALDVFLADVAFGPCRKEYEWGHPPYITSLSSETDGHATQISNRDLIIHFLTGSFINPCATMWRADFVREHEGWNEGLVRSQDYEIVYRCLLRGAKASLTEKGCGVYYHHSSEHRVTMSTSKERWKSQMMARLIVINEAKAAGLFDDYFRQAFVHHMGLDMRMWARHADDDSYRLVKEMFKELGGTRRAAISGGSGSLIHLLGCFLLGLRRKEQLALKLSALKKQVGSRRIF